MRQAVAPLVPQESITMAYIVIIVLAVNILKMEDLFTPDGLITGRDGLMSELVQHVLLENIKIKLVKMDLALVKIVQVGKALLAVNHRVKRVRKADMKAADGVMPVRLANTPTKPVKQGVKTALVVNMLQAQEIQGVEAVDRTMVVIIIPGREIQVVPIPVGIGTLSPTDVTCNIITHYVGWGHGGVLGVKIMYKCIIIFF